MVDHIKQTVFNYRVISRLHKFSRIKDSPK